MLLVAELLHVEVEQRLARHLGRLLLPRRHAEVQPVQAGPVQLARQGHARLFLEQNKRESLFEGQSLNLARILKMKRRW